MNWSYTDASQTVVHRTDENGREHSCLVAVIPEGDVINSWIPTVLVPASVDARQIRLALTQMGLRSSVENAISGGDQDLRDWWEFSLHVERTHPRVLAMAAALNVPSNQLDSLWTLAATL